MSLKLEPMSEEDYLAIGYEVKEGFGAQSSYYNASLDSTNIFGSDAYTGGEKSVGIDHRRGYIHLCKPVINYTITRKNAALARSILGQEKAMMEDVISFRTCYDTELGEYLPTDDVDRIDGILWGPEILKMWIDEFDIEAAIEMELWEVMAAYKKANTSVSGEGEFRIANSGGYVAAGNWHFFPSDNCTYDDFATFLGKTTFYSYNSRLSYLINLQGHKERMYSFLTEYVAVVPLGMRPDIDNRHDQLSMAYDDIISANKNMRMVMSGMPDPRAFVKQYKALSDKVYNLMVEAPAYKSSRKSILRKISSKQGHIRSKMLGKRVDYSGRSVITIDPFLSIRNVKIPKDIAPKLFRSHILTSLSNPNPADWIGADKRDKCISKLMGSSILDDVPVVIGRQPTLHKPSIRAFTPELTDERSIRINPLCVTGFNADFDGDQMWCRVPISDGAVQEVKELMNIEQNIYYPKNGECSVMPRQEIIYGLNVCTRSNLMKGASIKSYRSADELFDDIFMQRVKVSDTVTLDGYTECAGRVAFAACLPKPVFQKFGMEEITSKSITKYVEEMFETDLQRAIDGIDMMVKLGFKVGYLYPPTLNLLDEEDINYSSEIEKFHQSMAETTDYYERGLEEESTFDREYSDNFAVLESTVKDSIYDRVGSESGFVRLAESGARGSKSNMIQMYGYKGRIQKSAKESFKAVIEHSYTEQLTPLEHFVTAYGGRQGLINKSLNTADTGYAMRQMWHATSPYVITCDDCGTSEGVDIKKSDIAMFTDKVDEVNRVFCKIITGRYEAGTNRYITKQLAQELCDSGTVVTIRSPITCQDPCCKRCYGDDPSTHRMAAIGLPIGFIAAHSVGEPGTQLSMDSFKKGGIASKGGVTSSFAKLEAYIECSDLSNGKLGTYDPIAWESGAVEESYNNDGTKYITIEGSRIRKKLPAEAAIKKVAVKGEGLCVTRGDYDIKELLMYGGVREAQTYLLHTLYHIYKDECEISMKHFEVLVAAMTMHMVVSTDRDDLYVGQYHDSIQLHKGSLDKTVYVTTLHSVRNVQLLRPYTLSRIIMESVHDGLSSSVLLGLSDPLEYPLNRIMLGQEVYCGGTGDYLSERKI